MNITTEQYEALLKSAPSNHKSDEFIDFLRNNNVVILETKEWLVIENIKYHKEELPWYTAFYKGEDKLDDMAIQKLQWEFPECRYMINSIFTRSVKRFHIHLFRADKEYTIPAQ